jgi:hypothetical protein
MSLPEKTKAPDKASLLFARQPSGLVVLPVTPSPKKGNGSDDRFIDEASLSDERKPSSLTVSSVAKMQLSYGEHMLIPVTAHMIHLSVSKGKRFFLKDSHSLHMVKLVGAVWNYDEGKKNTKINVEDGTGLVRVMLWHEQNECSAAAALHRTCKVNSYTCVIGEERSYFKMKEIMACDVCPASSGNEMTYHLLEVAYSFEKMMEYFEDKEFNAVDIDRFICERKEAIVKQKGGPMKSNGE